MDQSGIDKLLPKIHWRWPTLALMRKDQINRDVWDEWALALADFEYRDAYRVFQGFSRGEIPVPGGRTSPDLAAFLLELRRLRIPKPQAGPLERVEPIRLTDFKHGDYVVLNPPKFPRSAIALPGGEVHKGEDMDLVVDVPYRVGSSEWEYILGCVAVFHPADLQHIKRMNPEQAKAWAKQISEWLANGKARRFMNPKKEKRGGAIEKVGEIF